MNKYISSVCSGPQEDFTQLENLSRGARLVNSVISGNILDEIDIYQKEDSKYSSSKKEAGGLTSNQRCLNYLTNFLRQVGQQDDLLSSMRILKNSSLFFASHFQAVRHLKQKGNIDHRYMLKHSLSNVLNVYEIQQTQTKLYLAQHAKLHREVQGPLFQTQIENQQQILEQEFISILSRQATFVGKAVINRVDELFSAAQIQEEEKSEFSNA